MKSLEITNRIEPTKNPTNVFVMVVEFDNGDSGKVTHFFTDSEEDLLIKTESMYRDYMERLDDDWNSWCNVEESNVEEVATDNGMIEEIKDGASEDELDDYDDKVTDFVSDYWRNSCDSDCLAMPTSVKITFFDKDGIEYNTRKV